eukprot:3912827-Lingulodinium_polyedra.AAC.1
MARARAGSPCIAPPGTTPTQRVPDREPRPYVRISFFTGARCDRFAVRVGMWRGAARAIVAECHPETRQ